MSPVIPQYQSSVLPASNVAAQKIPEGMARGGPEQALEQAGEAISNIGQQWADKLSKAQAAHELSSGMADFQVQAHQLYSQTVSSEAFKKDPESGGKILDQGLKDLRQNISGGMKNSLAKEHFENQSVSHGVSYINQMNDSIRKTQIDQLKAGGVINNQKFQSAAVAAPDGRTFHDALKGGLASLDGEYRLGALGAEEYATKRAKFIEDTLHHRAQREMWENPQALVNKLDDPKSEYAQITNKNGDVVYPGLSEKTKTLVRQQAEKHGVALMHEARDQTRFEESERVKKTNTDAVNSLTATYNLNSPNADYGKAYEETQDPEKAAALGLTTLEQRTHVGNVIMAQGAKVAKDARDKRNAGDHRFLRQVYEDKIPAEQFSTYVDPETKQPISDRALKAALKWANTEESVKNRTDVAVYADLRNRVLDSTRPDHITDPLELGPFYGEGLGRAAGNDLTKLIQTTQDPEKAKWFTMSISAFDKRHHAEWQDATNIEDAMAVSDRRNAFIMQLHDETDKGKLSGSAIFGKATEMMKKEGGEGERKADTGVTPSTGKRILPKPKDQSATGKGPEQPKAKFAGIDPKTGAPAFKLPDGSHVIDTTQKPEVIGTNKKTGQTVVRMPDGKPYNLPVEKTAADPVDEPIQPLPESSTARSEEEIEDDLPPQDNEIDVDKEDAE